MKPTLDVVGKPTTVTNALTVCVAADADTTRRALDQLELFTPALRALRGLGLSDRVTLIPGGLSWRTDDGNIDVAVDVRVAPEHEGRSSLTIVTRCTASDERTHQRLLDAWPVLGPLAATLVKRAARAVKDHAEHDRFDTAQTIEEDAIAA